PCAPWQRKTSHAPQPTAPKLGGSPQSQSFFQPSFSNQMKLWPMSETFRMGVSPFACMAILQHKQRGRSQPWIGIKDRLFVNVCTVNLQGWHECARPHAQPLESVDRPEPAGDELGEVPVRVAEVEAPRPAGPGHDALDGDTLYPCVFRAAT